MSAEKTETTRWSLIVVGLALAGAIVWWDNAGEISDDASIIEPVSRNESTARSAPPRDFVADLSKRGVAATLNPVAAIQKTSLQATIKRPLFAPTRRQPAPPPPRYTPPPAPPPPPNPADLKLVGVMVGNDGAVALVRTNRSQGTISVRRGEIIEGWTIDEINSRQMKVHKDNVAATIGVSSGRQSQPRFQPRAPTGRFPGRPIPGRPPAADEGMPVPDETGEIPYDRREQ